MTAPACLLFLLDRSQSMNALGDDGRPLGDVAADSVHQALELLAALPPQTPPVDVAVWEYRTDRLAAAHVAPVALPGAKASPQGWIQASDLKAASPVGEAPRLDLAPRGRYGSAACAALAQAVAHLDRWRQDNPRPRRRLLVHISDGQPRDGDPRDSLAASDKGDIQLWHAVLGTAAGSGAVLYPSSLEGLPGASGELGAIWFDLASELPPEAGGFSHDWEIGALADGARGLVLGASAADLDKFLGLAISLAAA